MKIWKCDSCTDHYPCYLIDMGLNGSDKPAKECPFVPSFINADWRELDSHQTIEALSDMGDCIQEEGTK